MPQLYQSPPYDPRTALADARLYLCTDSRSVQGDLADFLDAVLAGGVDIVQLREKGLEARAELAALETMAAAAEAHGKPYCVNDRADLAHAIGAPMLHLGQDDLPVPLARRILGDGPVIGRSTHTPAQVDAAAGEPGVDYFCAGPTWTTPTKPGRPAAGLDLLRYAAAVSPPSPPSAPSPPFPPSLVPASGPGSHRRHPRTDAATGGRPWFAIGGIDADRLDAVLAAGARRVVVVRAITAADDPGAAARALAARLRGAA